MSDRDDAIERLKALGYTATKNPDGTFNYIKPSSSADPRDVVGYVEDDGKKREDRGGAFLVDPPDSEPS